MKSRASSRKRAASRMADEAIQQSRSVSLSEDEISDGDTCEPETKKSKKNPSQTKQHKFKGCLNLAFKKLSNDKFSVDDGFITAEFRNHLRKLKKFYSKYKQDNIKETDFSVEHLHGRKMIVVTRATKKKLKNIINTETMFNKKTSVHVSARRFTPILDASGEITCYRHYYFVARKGTLKKSFDRFIPKNWLESIAIEENSKELFIEMSRKNFHAWTRLIKAMKLPIPKLYTFNSLMKLFEGITVPEYFDCIAKEQKKFNKRFPNTKDKELEEIINSASSATTKSAATSSSKNQSSIKVTSSVPAISAKKPSLSNTNEDSVNGNLASTQSSISRGKEAHESEELSKKEYLLILSKLRDKEVSALTSRKISEFLEYPDRDMIFGEKISLVLKTNKPSLLEVLLNSAPDQSESYLHNFLIDGMNCCQVKDNFAAILNSSLSKDNKKKVIMNFIKSDEDLSLELQSCVDILQGANAKACFVELTELLNPEIQATTPDVIQEITPEAPEIFEFSNDIASTERDETQLKLMQALDELEVMKLKVQENERNSLRQEEIQAELQSQLDLTKNELKEACDEKAHVTRSLGKAVLELREIKEAEQEREEALKQYERQNNLMEEKLQKALSGEVETKQKLDQVVRELHQAKSALSAQQEMKAQLDRLQKKLKKSHKKTAKAKRKLKEERERQQEVQLKKQEQTQTLFKQFFQTQQNMFSQFMTPAQAPMLPTNPNPTIAGIQNSMPLANQVPLSASTLQLASTTANDLNFQKAGLGMFSSPSQPSSSLVRQESISTTSAYVPLVNANLQAGKK